jgi:hypothetical protein
MTALRAVSVGDRVQQSADAVHLATIEGVEEVFREPG